MGWSQAEQGCQFHPYHNIKQGVCPYCLREKLSSICVSSLVDPSSPDSSGFSTLFSRSNLFSAEHFRGRGHHQRHGSTGSVSFRVRNVGGLDKSRTVAWNQVGEVKNEKIKRGFWSKLFLWKGKKEVLRNPVMVKGVLC